jgi:hypothetical protein
VVTQEIQQGMGLAAGRAQMNVRNEDGAKGSEPGFAGTGLIRGGQRCGDDTRRFRCECVVGSAHV